jgi:hypothetical protein
MQLPEFPPKRPAGFTLPAILVVVSALLILAVGVLLVVGIERNTARAFVDQERAELAARAGLENVKAILVKEAANDDFLILQSSEIASGSKKDPLPYLYLARGSGGEASVKYRYLPLFSTAVVPETGATLEAPKASDLVGGDTKEMTTLPWYDPAKVAWIEVPDVTGKVVSRYAYWVEDLQSKVNAKVAGNVAGIAGVHARGVYPAPGSKPLDTKSPTLGVIAVHVIDPKSGDIPDGDLTRKVIDGRPAMISPDSVLGATALSAPLPRSKETGLLEDPLAAALERSVSPVVQAYREQPVVPYAAGISKDVAGKPKLNLNQLLRTRAVGEFSDWVNKALPDFDKRKGGFPEDYLQTLAANAFDYADTDNDPTVAAGAYRGLDGNPMLSEIVVKLEYLGPRGVNGRLILDWRVKVFGEFWNMTNQPVSGKASLSYEVALNHEAIGEGTTGIPFDDDSMLRDPAKSTHNLTFRNGHFFGPVVPVILAPDEYKFYQFAEVRCSIDAAPNNVNYKTKFTLIEKPYARGLSVLWNGVETERIDKIVRDLGPVGSGEMTFTILTPKKVGKAAIPGGSYGPYPDFTNNMGDPRMARYLKNVPLSENSLKNLSPNRRNVRRSTIYNSDSAEKRLHYGRVLPSEWPDGGHNSAIGTFFQPTTIDLEIEPTATTYQNAPAAITANAPMRLTNAGRFHSAAELGNVYDPVMWTPAYVDLPGKPGSGESDTTALNLPYEKGKASMPSARNSWPEVTAASAPSTDHGGGNTLRIGRPEHQRFDAPGWSAASLLDLFHAGDADSPAGEGAESETVSIDGQINVNTAEKDALRAMAAGMLRQDPELRRVSSWAHDVASGKLNPTTVKLDLGSPTLTKAADRIAEGIIRSRPFASMRDLSLAKVEAQIAGDPDLPVFGNKAMYSQGEKIQWSDAAAEEIFARVHDAATLRSRNFRVWVIGQAVSKSGDSVQVLAESRRAFTLFADPGERKSDGSIDPAKCKPRVIYENDF